MSVLGFEYFPGYPIVFLYCHSIGFDTGGGAGSKRRGLSLAVTNFHFEGRDRETCCPIAGGVCLGASCRLLTLKVVEFREFSTLHSCYYLRFQHDVPRSHHDSLHTIFVMSYQHILH
jgi:hypothetical protein